MKAIYILMHQRKHNAAELMHQLTDALRRAGIKACAEPWLYRMAQEGGENPFCSDQLDGCEAILSVGGDGTLLRANTLALKRNLPVLGINIGRVGFLTEIEMHQLDEACEKLSRDDYIIESRMMLEADIQGVTYHALNDVVVSRGGYSRLIGIDAWVDQNPIGRFMADGMIIATPTGSTGYSLSAGGPIICPELECMLLTPICAHSLQHRPVITSSKQTVTIRLVDTDIRAMVSIDGKETIPFGSNQLLTVRQSDLKARFIRMEPGNFSAKSGSSCPNGAAEKESTPMKSARQIAILEIISERVVETQEDLADALRKHGFQVTQATVSRDIKELRLVKVLSADGSYRYATSEKNENSLNERLVRLFSETVISINSAYNQIIIKTLSASASIAAETIDSLQWPEILGTIAGENTILMIVRSIEEVPLVVDRLNAMIRR